MGIPFEKTTGCVLDLAAIATLGAEPYGPEWRALRVAALEYTRELLSKIQIVDGEHFKHQVNQILTDVIDVAKDPKVGIP